MEQQDGQTIAKWFLREESRLVSIDPTVRLEMRFFDGMTGAQGQERLQTQFLSFLPTIAKHVNVAQAVQNLEKLQSSGLCKICGA
jgi:hypothetical protein